MQRQRCPKTPCNVALHPEHHTPGITAGARQTTWLHIALFEVHHLLKHCALHPSVSRRPSVQSRPPPAGAAGAAPNLQPPAGVRSLCGRWRVWRRSHSKWAATRWRRARWRARCCRCFRRAARPAARGWEKTLHITISDTSCGEPLAQGNNGAAGGRAAAVAVRGRRSRQAQVGNQMHCLSPPSLVMTSLDCGQ